MEALLTDTLVWKRKALPTVLGFNSRELCIFTFPKAAEDTFRVYELDVSFAFALSLYTRMKSHLPLYLEIFSISLFVTINLYHFQSLFVWLFVFSHTTLLTLQNTPWILCLCLDYVTKSSKQQYSQTLTKKFLAFPVFMCSNYLWVSSRKRPSNSYIPSGRYFTNHSHKMLKVVTTGQMVGQTVSAYIICNYLTDWPARQVNS